MELKIGREELRFETLAADVCRQITIEGEAVLPGSMRDAVTVLSVQAQAHLTGVQAATDRIAVRGRAAFSVLYTQGDLTRIRVIETTCDFTHQIEAKGVTPGMRAEAAVCVRETNGAAGSGRLSLSAQLEISAQAFAGVERSAVADVQGEVPLCKKAQTLQLSTSRLLGEEKTLVREEYDLPERLGVQDVLTASATAQVQDITGASGRIGVSGVIEIRVLHRPEKAGEPLVETTHEAPFQVTIPAEAADGMPLTARAQVIDVMADSAAIDRRRTMRVEAEVCVRLFGRAERSAELLEDLYSTAGPMLEPQSEEIAIAAIRECGSARESVRIQATLPADAPPIETVLAAFASPLHTSYESAGRRLNAQGVMGLTLLYLPVDSDIPYAVHTREPFSMTFPIETGEGTQAQLQVIECGVGPATSDRVELRCVLGIEARTLEISRMRVVTDIHERPEEKHAHGFVLVWPAPGESRWDTAKRLRVAQESLRPAGATALMALRK